MAGIGVTEVVQSQPAETRTLAYGAPACREPEPPLALGVSREQEGAGAPVSGKRIAI